MKRNKTIDETIPGIQKNPLQEQAINSINKILDIKRLDPITIDLLGLIDIPVWAYNEESRIVFWNAAAEKKFGYSTLSILNEIDPFKLVDSLKSNSSFIKTLSTKSGRLVDFSIKSVQWNLPDNANQIWVFANDISTYVTNEKNHENRLTHLNNLAKIIDQSESIAYIRKNDLNWTVTYISSNSIRIGYKTEELIAQKIGFSELIHSDDVARVKAEVLFVIHHKEKNIHLEYRLITKDGSYIWVSDVIEVIYDLKGIATSFHGVITDISFRKSSEEKIKDQSTLIKLHNEELFKVNDTLKKSFDNLRVTNQKLIESEEKFKLLSEQSLLGIIIIHNGQLKYFNQAFLGLCGYSKEEVENWNEYEFINIIHPDNRPFILDRLNKRIDSDLTDEINFTFRGITKNGEIRWFSQWAKTIVFEEKKSTFITIIDINEQQKWQEALAESENRLRTKLEFILSPEKPGGNFKLTDIFEIEQLQKIQDAFATSHNITSVITDVEGKPITVPSNISPICKLVRSSKKGRELCELSDKIIGEEVRRSLKPHSANCLSCGFIETGAPIIVAGNHIANWMMGQGLNNSIDEVSLIEIAHRMGIEGFKLLDAYQNTTFIKIKHFNKIIDFLWIMAKEISSLGYNNIKLARDIEERKKVEEELIRSKNKAEESDRLKSAFLANMSHEIRTPMNGILGFANVLNDDDVTSEQRKEYIEIINQNGNLLLKLIDDILDIAKMEANQLTLDEKPCYIDQILHEQYLLFKNQIEHHKPHSVKLILKLPETKLDKLVYVDNIRLTQILSNLLTNAIKFTQTGFIEFGYITEFPSHLKFYVKDTGIGLPPEKRNIIFDRFRQADETTSRKYGGTGLGLAISKNLVKLMKGNIWVESEVGKGSTFIFTIPYKPYCDEEIIKMLPVKDKQPKIKDYHGKMILIVDDEQLNFHYLYEILKNTNAKIIQATTGKEAIDICRNNNLIDLILMDIKMPKINGYQATKEIRLFRPDVPIIAQSACVGNDEKELCLQSGCNDFISKPITPSKLLQIIDSHFYKFDTVPD